MPAMTGQFIFDTKALQNAAELARMLAEANLDDPAQKSLFTATDRLPFKIARSVLYDQELMGNDIGLIRRIFLRDETSPEALRKKKEAKDRAIAKWLQEMIRYAQLLWDVAFKVAVAEKAVVLALDNISAQRSQILAAADGTPHNAFSTISDPQGEIAALDQTAERLARFKEKVVARAQAKLEALPPPSAKELQDIDIAIENERRETPVFAKAFEYVLEHAVAPAAAYAYQYGIKPLAQSVDAHIAAMHIGERKTSWHPEAAANQNEAAGKPNLHSAFAQSGASGDDDVEDGDGKGDVRSAVVKIPALYRESTAVAVDPE